MDNPFLYKKEKTEEKEPNRIMQRDIEIRAWIDSLPESQQSAILNWGKEMASHVKHISPETASILLIWIALQKNIRVGNHAKKTE